MYLTGGKEGFKLFRVFEETNVYQSLRYSTNKQKSEHVEQQMMHITSPTYMYTYAYVYVCMDAYICE